MILYLIVMGITSLITSLITGLIVNKYLVTIFFKEIDKREKQKKEDNSNHFFNKN